MRNFWRPAAVVPAQNPLRLAQQVRLHLSCCSLPLDMVSIGVEK